MYSKFTVYYFLYNKRTPFIVSEYEKQRYVHFHFFHGVILYLNSNVVTNPVAGNPYSQGMDNIK